MESGLSKGLAVLYTMPGGVAANPQLFDPDAQERIHEAIARIEDVELRVKAA